MAHPADGVSRLDDRFAREWDADRNRFGDHWPDKPWLDRFAAALPRGAHVLDLGCGTGFPVARHLTRLGFRITGVDAAPAAVALGRTPARRSARIAASRSTTRASTSPRIARC